MDYQKEIKKLKEENKELKAKIKLYEMMCHTLSEAVIVSDFKGKILFVNERAVKIGEFKNAYELLGKNTLSFLAPESRRKALRDYLNVLRGKEGYISVYKIKTKKGRNIWAESIGHKIDFMGKKAVLTTLRDVTDKKILEDQIKESEEKLQLIIENLPIHLAAIDKTGKFILWNKYSEHLFGYQKKEVIGKLGPARIHASPKDVQEVLKVATQKGYFEADCWMRRKDKSKFLMHLFVVPWYDKEGKIQGFVGNGIDVTHHREIENTLKEKLKELERLNDLMVGRELKMIELKKKIKELENKLKVRNGLR